MYRKKCTVCIMLIFIKVLDRAFKIPAPKNLNVISAVSGENVHCGTVKTTSSEIYCFCCMLICVQNFRGQLLSEGDYFQGIATVRG